MAVRLIAETGRTTGSRPSGRLRTTGSVPAVVYGLGADPLAVSVAWPDLRKLLASDSGLNTLIDLDVDGDVSLSIVKDLQRHPVRRDVIHVDFLRLDPDAEIAVDVPLHLTGEATKVAKQHGIVEHALHQLRIHVRPIDIPDVLTADITDLDVGSTLTVSDVALPAGVRTEVDPDDVVATAYVPRRVAALMAQGEGEGEAGGASGEAAEGDQGGGAEEAATDESSDDASSDGEG